jgi:hypothetical protein
VTPGQPAPDVDSHDSSTRDEAAAVTASAGTETLEPEALSLRHDSNCIGNAAAEGIALSAFPAREPSVRGACRKTMGHRAGARGVCWTHGQEVARRREGEGG